MVGTYFSAGSILASWPRPQTGSFGLKNNAWWILFLILIAASALVLALHCCHRDCYETRILACQSSAWKVWLALCNKRVKADFFLYNWLIISFFGCAGSSFCCTQASPCGEQGLLSRPWGSTLSAQASSCRGFSCCGARAPGCVGFSSCSSRTPGAQGH